MYQFRIGEFARRAGVTIRTLRYYDKLGLLKPVARSESGQRLYTEADDVRLQQIMTLKLIGLSLEEIALVLRNGELGIPQLLSRQRQVLEEKIRRLQAVVQTIQQAQAAMQALQPNSPAQFIQIIQAVHMHDQTNWLALLTDEQKEKLAGLQDTWTLAEQRELGQLGAHLFADIQQQLNCDVHDPVAQALVDRWDAFIAQFAQADSALAAKMNQLYLGIGSDALEGDAWMQGWQQAVDFIQRARAVR
jgi:DNA-binding transcriptional MerR regulator